MRGVLEPEEQIQGVGRRVTTTKQQATSKLRRRAAVRAGRA